MMFRVYSDLSSKTLSVREFTTFGEIPQQYRPVFTSMLENNLRDLATGDLIFLIMGRV